MDNLYDKLKQAQETTTSAAIAFAPGALFPGPIPPANTGFPGMIDTWEEFDKRRKQRVQKLREDIDGQIVDTQNQIGQILQGFVNNSKLTYRTFMKFGGISDLTPRNVMIDILSSENSIGKIKARFSSDIGENQLVLTQLQNNKPLQSFEEFYGFDYILGARLKSVPERTIVMVYEGAMNMEYTETESITIGDPDILSQLQQRTKCKVVNSGKWGKVYPLDRYFDGIFYKTLNDIIKSDFDGSAEGEANDEADGEA